MLLRFLYSCLLSQDRDKLEPNVKPLKSGVWWHVPAIPALGSSGRRMDKLDANLCYTESFRSVPGSKMKL